MRLGEVEKESLGALTASPLRTLKLELRRLNARMNANSLQVGAQAENNGVLRGRWHTLRYDAIAYGRVCLGVEGTARVC